MLPKSKPKEDKINPLGLEDPNQYRIAIPKVNVGIGLIEGHKYPIIVCQCGNHDQRKFGSAMMSELFPKKEKPWQFRRVKVEHVICRACNTSISRFEFDMKAQKVVKENELKYNKSNPKPDDSKRSGDGKSPKNAKRGAASGSAKIRKADIGKLPNKKRRS